MYCPQCGKPINEGDAFCGGCGTKIECKGAPGASQQKAAGSAGQAASQAQGPYGAAPQQPYGGQAQSPYSGQAQSPYGGQAHNPYGGAPYGAPSQQPYGGGYSASSQHVPAEGCLSAAWRDITSSDGWFGRVCLLGVVGAIPILGWFADGYILKWAREVPLGRKNPMPQGVFAEGAFSLGFFAWVVMLIVAAVSWVCGFILGLVPLVGALASLAFAVLLSMFANVALVRMAIAKRFGAAFDISAIWQEYRKSLGSLFCASMVPAIVAAIVIAILATIVAMIVGIGAVAGAAVMPSYGYSSHHALTAVIASLGIGSIILLIIGWIVCAGIWTCGTLVSFRAVGHWIARVAPQWVQIAPESQGQSPYGSQPPYGGVPPQGF